MTAGHCVIKATLRQIALEAVDDSSSLCSKSYTLAGIPWQLSLWSTTSNRQLQYDKNEIFYLILSYLEVRVTLGEYVLKSDVEPLPARNYGASKIKEKPTYKIIEFSASNNSRHT